MKIARIISMGIAAIAMSASAAFGQQTRSGTITQINRLTNTIAIKPIQSGTVGANTSGAAEEFQIQGGMSLDDMHAGDNVSFTASEAGNTKTVTKLEKR